MKTIGSRASTSGKWAMRSDSTPAPRRNAEDDPYFTDGLRAVLFLADDPMPVSDVQLLRWWLPAHLEPYREKLETDPDFWTYPKEPGLPRFDEWVTASNRRS